MVAYSSNNNSSVSVVFFKDCFDEFKSLESFLENEYTYSEQLSEGGWRCVITNESLEDDSKIIWMSFLETLGVDTYINNAGTVLFDENNNRKYHVYPTIGIDKEHGLGLRIGTKLEECGFTSYFVPLVPIEVESDDEDDDEKVIKYFFVTPNGKKIKTNLTTVSDRNKATGEEIIRNYITIKSKNKITFNLTFKARRDENDSVCVTSSDIVNAWDNGTFDDVVNPFMERSMKKACTLNHMFVSYFDRKEIFYRQFPREGVLFILTGGKKQISEIPGKNKVVFKTNWRILECSHPELLVSDWNYEKTKEFVLLGDVGLLSCTDSCKITQDYIRKPEIAREIYFLHIISENTNDNASPHWMPEHSGTYLPVLIPFVVKKNFSNILEKYLPQKPQNNQKMLPQSRVNNVTSFEQIPPINSSFKKQEILNKGNIPVQYTPPSEIIDAVIDDCPFDDNDDFNYPIGESDTKNNLSDTVGGGDSNSDNQSVTKQRTKKTKKKENITIAPRISVEQAENILLREW